MVSSSRSQVVGMVHCKVASPVLQITKLVYEVSEEDVTRARNQLKASILFSMDGSGGALFAVGDC
jgi:hypothetical protein